MWAAQVSAQFAHYELCVCEHGLSRGAGRPNPQCSLHSWRVLALGAGRHHEGPARSRTATGTCTRTDVPTRQPSNRWEPRRTYRQHRSATAPQRPTLPVQPVAMTFPASSPRRGEPNPRLTGHPRWMVRYGMASAPPGSRRTRPAVPGRMQSLADRSTSTAPSTSATTVVAGDPGRVR